MLEGDRYEVLDITTKPTSEYVGLRFRDMPIRGAMIGAIVRDGRAVFPRSDEVLQAGRPRDRLHGDEARAGRRARPVTRPERSRRPDPRPGVRWGSTCAGALALTGHDAHVPQRRRRSCRSRSRSGTASRSGRSSPQGRSPAPSASASTRLGRRSPGPIGFREGYLVVSLTWLARGHLRRPALPLRRARRRSRVRSTRSSRACPGFSTTGATVVINVDALDRSLLIWRQLSQWLGGMGIIVLALAVLPRLRIGGRQMFESELPGPEVHQLAERIRDTARRLWLLYIALTLVLFGLLLVIGLSGPRRPHGPFQAIAHALTTMPLGGFSTDPRSLEPFAPVTQWVSRCSWRSPASTSRSSTSPSSAARPGRARAATRRRGSTARCSCSARPSSSSSSSTPASSPARRRCGRPSSRRRR